MLGKPLYFDFDQPAPAPDWIVDGLLERGTITVLSADSGSGKSLICSSIIVSIIQHKPWLGRGTHGDRAMVLDEENFTRVVHSRLRALGMSNDNRTNLTYFLRLGVKLGEEDWRERIEEELQDRKPDLLVIDTAAAATTVDVNDNTSVARLYAHSLRPLADHDVAVVLLHHERKPQGNTRRHAGHAMMGARQWAGQADAHIALERLGDVAEEPLGDGRHRRRFPLKMEMPKNRDGASVSEKLAIVSEHDEHDNVQWLKVERMGAQQRL